MADLVTAIGTSLKAGYALVKLRTAYAGQCIRVRRDSDDAEQDIGFDANNELDWAAADAFKGAANLFVRTWYDQGTGGIDVGESNTSFQFGLDTTNKRLTGTGGVHRLLSSLNIGISGDAAFTIFSKFSESDSNREVMQWPPGGGSLAGFSVGVISSAVRAGFFAIGSNYTQFSSTPNSGTIALWTFRKAAGAFVANTSAWRDGVSISSDANAGDGTPNITNGVLMLGSSGYNGTMEAVVIVNSALGSTERAAGEDWFLNEGWEPGPPEITTTTLPNGTVGEAYSQTLAATGGTAPITWSVTVGSLPDGLSLNASTGEISGTPTLADAFTFTVEAEDAGALTDTQELTITIEAAPVPPAEPISGVEVVGVDGVIYHLFQTVCAVRDYDEGIGFSRFLNELGDGFRSRTLFGANTGWRSFELTLPTLSGASADSTVTGINRETVTPEEYLWALYCECEAVGVPFVIRSPRNDQYYLVEFRNERLSYRRFLAKMYSSGVELRQVRIPGVSVFDCSRVSGLAGFWDVDTVFDGDDWVGTDGPFIKTGDVVTVTGAPHGHYTKQLNSTTDSGSVVATGVGSVTDVIMAVKFREATFSGNAAVFGNSGDAAFIKGDSGATKFLDPGLTNFHYSLNGTEYDADNMQAPMNEWGVVHFRNTDGWAVPDGLRVGADSGGNYAEMDLGDVVLLNGAAMITCREIIEHLIIKFRTARSAVLPEPEAPPTAYLGSEINHVIGAGQSLMVGGKGEPAISLAQPYSNVTFTDGVRSYVGAFDTLIPLVESDADTWEGSDRGETPMSGAVNYVTELLSDPVDHIFLASTAARGGTAITFLKKGGVYYFLFGAQVQGGFDRAADDTKTYELQAVLWGHGETDQSLGTSYQSYKDQLIQLRSDYEADAQAISGQTQRIPMICYQVTAYVTGGTHGVPKAQLDASVEDDDIYLATPLYIFPFDDTLHLTNIGYLWLGHYFGKVFYEVVNWSREWNGLRPKNISIVGTTVTVEFFVPVAPLVLDTTNVGATTDSGFSVVDNSGSIGISSVTVVGDDTVEIELDSAPGANPRLRYGLDYSPSGSITHLGGGGNLRDSDPASFDYDSDTYNLYNWCVLFEKPIPFTTESEAPTVPGNLAAAMVSDTEIDVTWDAATDNIGVTQYWLQRATDAGFTKYVTTIYLGNVTSYSDTGLAPDLEYFYRVKAGDANNNFSAYSTADSATTDTNAFVPSDVTGMVQWLDVDDLALADNDPVATWPDASGNANDADQSTSGDRPVFKTNIANGKSIVRYDGGTSGNYLNLGDLSALTEGEIFIVVKTDNDPATDANGGLWVMGTSGNNTRYPFAEGTILDDFGSTVRKTTPDPATPLNQFNVYSVFSATNDWASYINGVLHHSTASNTVGFPADAELGRSSDVNQRFDGDIGDLIIYDHKLTGTERTNVVNYLRSKFGIGN